MNDAMRLAAQQMASAQQMMATTPTADAAMSPDAAHQAAVDAAQLVAPRIASLPKSMQQMQISGIRAGLDMMAPETRDACLEIYRSAGIDI